MILAPWRDSWPVYVDMFKERQRVDAASQGIASPPEFPEEGSLLPFGGIDDVYFCWKTEGDAESWNVVVAWGASSETQQVFELSATQFLLDLLQQQIRVDPFPAWDPETLVRFDSEIWV